MAHVNVGATIEGALPVATAVVGDHTRRPGQRKAVNAFMAFRAYYQGLFPGVEQRERSSYLTFLWQRENGQARWTVLAQAFTVIRDTAENTEEPNPDLRSFLGANAAFIGLPPPPETNSSAEARTYLATVNAVTGPVSVEEVVANSMLHGYLPVFAALIPGIDTAVDPHDDHHALTGMAVNQESLEATAEYVPVDDRYQDVIEASAQQAYNNMVVDQSLGETINSNVSFDIWSLRYRQQINELNLPAYAEALTYRGSDDNNDQMEFAEGSEVQTDFDPFAGDSWLTYDIGVPSEEIFASMMQI